MQILAITANQLKRARELADLSQERLAARAGLSRQTVWEYERAGDEPAARTKLADAVAVLQAAREFGSVMTAPSASNDRRKLHERSRLSQ